MISLKYMRCRRHLASRKKPRLPTVLSGDHLSYCKLNRIIPKTKLAIVETVDHGALIVAVCSSLKLIVGDIYLVQTKKKIMIAHYYSTYIKYLPNFNRKLLKDRPTHVSFKTDIQICPMFPILEEEISDRSVTI